MTWASRATALGMEFVLPPVLGHYLDTRWGTEPLLTVLGAVFGFSAGMVHLLQIARQGSRR
jgi:F0F1-type ATP synthase assembly protein I